MRILYHHRTLGDGAEGVHIDQMIRAFRELGHEVRVVCPKSASAGRSAASVPENQSVIARVKRFMPRVAYRVAEVGYNVVSYLSVLNAIRSFRPDFVYERYACFNFGGVVAANRSRIPVILEVNTPYSVAWSMYDKLYFPKLAGTIEKLVWRRASRIATVSTALKVHLVEQGICAEKILVTPNGVNPEKIAQATSPDATKAKLKLKLPTEAVIGFVGSLRKWHGIQMFAEVVAEVCSANTECHFLVVGDGDFRSGFESYIDDAGMSDRVTFTGSVPHDEVFDYISKMDIAVMPDSNFYGSPLKVFEYMAMGVTTVAPRLGPLEEVITHKEHGMLFEPKNSAALRDVLLSLVENQSERLRIGSQAREHVLANHTWRMNAEAVMNAYHQLRADPQHSQKLTQVTAVTS